MRGSAVPLLPFDKGRGLRLGFEAEAAAYLNKPSPSPSPLRRARRPIFEPPISFVELYELTIDMLIFRGKHRKCFCLLDAIAAF
jgi:hypothetical protein